MIPKAGRRPYSSPGRGGGGNVPATGPRRAGRADGRARVLGGTSVGEVGTDGVAVARLRLGGSSPRAGGIVALHGHHGGPAATGAVGRERLLGPRRLLQQAAKSPDAPAVPSLSTLHRAIRRDLTRGEWAGLKSGEAARRPLAISAPESPRRRALLRLYLAQAPRHTAPPALNRHARSRNVVIPSRLAHPEGREHNVRAQLSCGTGNTDAKSPGSPARIPGPRAVGHAATW